MRPQKFLLTFAMLMVLLIPTNGNVFAGEIEPYGAGWQLVNYQEKYMNGGVTYRSVASKATDGGNFKIEIYGGNSGAFTASMYVNGVYRLQTSTTSLSNGRGTIQFSGLKAGDTVYFDIYSYYGDNYRLYYYD